jgi:hypothetical protein
MFDKNDLRNYVTELSEDFMADYLITPAKQEWFINQVVSYAEDCCKTEQEISCFVDGLLMTFPD